MIRSLLGNFLGELLHLLDALIGHGGHTSETDGGYYNAENESKQVANHLISFRLFNGWIMTEPRRMASSHGIVDRSTGHWTGGLTEALVLV